MKSIAENIRHHLTQAPMLCALLPLVAGILLGQWWMVPSGYAIAIFLLLLIIALRRKNDYLLLLAILMAGVAACSLRSTPQLPKQGEMEIEIRHIIRQESNRTSAEGRVIAYRSDGRTHRSGADVRLTLEGQSVAEGDRLMVATTARAYDTTEQIGRYLSAQGFAAQIYISPNEILRHTSSSPDFIGRLQHLASQRIKQLQLSPDAEIVAMTAGIGNRGAISNELRRVYTLSGGAHLLAVSGLHVGFICVILNLLFALLTLLRGGQVIRSIIVIVAIWIYAAIAGLSPSVVRAATMFSIMQLATITYSSTRGINTLSFTAFVMLVIDARTIHDASFLLSFIAVAAILLWVAPYTRAERRLLPAQSRWHTLARSAAYRLLTAVEVSVAATAATLPLASHLFGTMSLWSILLSPIMIPLCGILVGATILWVIIPFMPLQGVAHWVIENTATAMNSIAKWVAESDLLINEVSISRGWCIGIYLVFLLLTLALWAWPTDRGRGNFEIMTRQSLRKD